MTPEEIIHALIERNLTICTAESCTGGMICADLTSVSGSSAVVAGGAVVYQTPMKNKILGTVNVCDENVVSRAVANYMATMVVQKFGTDIGVATTGYLEPYGEHQTEAFVSVLWPDAPPVCEHVELSPEQTRLWNRVKVIETAYWMLSTKLS